jgi:hypothetical protein
MKRSFGGARSDGLSKLLRAAIWGAPLGLAVTLGGCGSCANGSKVVYPAGDSTPPVLAALDAHFPNQPLQTVTNGSGPLTVRLIGKPVVHFIAGSEDPDAAGAIQIWLEETRWRNGVQEGPGLLGGPVASSPTPRPSSSEGCTRNLATYDLDVDKQLHGATAYRARAWTVATNTAGAEVKSDVMQLDWP